MNNLSVKRFNHLKGDWVNEKWAMETIIFVARDMVEGGSIKEETQR